MAASLQYQAVYMFDSNDLIGVPFVDGGRDKKTGFDCWGLALEVFRRHGVSLPDYKIGCTESSVINSEININRPFWKHIDEMEEIPVPALVVIRFNTGTLCNHVGVYIGGGRFIHTRLKIGVNIDRVDSPAWRRIIEGYYIPGPEALQNEQKPEP